jgi:hypothetical protein
MNLLETLAKLDTETEQSIRRENERLEQNKKKAENTYLFLQEIFNEGLKISAPDCAWDAVSPEYRIKDMKQWHFIHKVVGNLEVTNKAPASEDARKRLIRITLQPKDERFSHIKFCYVKKLPKGKKSKCKLVRVKSPGYLAVVCEK